MGNINRKSRTQMHLENTKEKLWGTQGNGGKLGATIHNRDVDKIEMEIYKHMRDIAYICIKIDSFSWKSSRRKRPKRQQQKRNIPSNAIAQKACVIQEILLYNGYSVVEENEMIIDQTIVETSEIISTRVLINNRE